MHLTTAPLLAAVLAAGLLTGCTTPTGPFPPRDTTKYTLENSERFVLLDQPAQVSVTCTGLQEITLPDGRLEVVANVKNRENRRLEVQVNCVFKDASGFSTGDETPWQTLILSEHATEAVRIHAVKRTGRQSTCPV